MEVLNPSAEVVARVQKVIEEAAGALLADGRADLKVVRLADLVELPDYDCPVVLLTPTNPEAAQVGVHVHEDDAWWIAVADGPGTELRDDMKEERYLHLDSLVRSVVQGRYRHGPCTRELKRLFRSPRLVEGWYETFETEPEPVSSHHFGRGAPAAERRFEPY